MKKLPTTPPVTLEDAGKDCRDPVELQYDQTDSQNNVQQRHNGNQLLRDPTDPLDTADEDQRDDDADENTDDQVAASCAVSSQQSVVDQRGVNGGSNGVDLGSIAGAKHGAYAKCGVQICQPHPLAAKTVFDVVHGTACVVAVAVAFPEVDGQGHFRELGAHTQQRRDPHPEYRAGTTEGNGTSDTCNITRTNSSGEGGADSLEGGNGAISGFLLLKHTTNGAAHGIAEFADLQKTGADAQVQANADDAYHGGHAPDKSV